MKIANYRYFCFIMKFTDNCDIILKIIIIIGGYYVRIFIYGVV